MAQAGLLDLMSQKGYQSVEINESGKTAQNGETSALRSVATWWKGVNKNVFYFAMRMSLILGIASLFVLVEDDTGHSFPSGLWVWITILLVSWFPGLDAASVLEKSHQRFMGTCIGASLGLLCGSTSLFMPTRLSQAWYLGISNMAVTFAVVFLSGTVTVRKKKILQSKGYGTMICLLTFSIALAPFYGRGDRKSHTAVVRILNVIIGCAIGAIGSVIFWPRSTVMTLFEKLRNQVHLAGESSSVVLHAAGDLLSSDRLNPLGLADELLGTSPQLRKRHRMSGTPNMGSIKDGGDNVLAKFGAAMAEWRSAKMLFPLIAWDPFKAGAGDEDLENFKLKSARILAQSLRIQTISMVLDGIIREGNDINFETEHIDYFVSVGTLIQEMLNAPMNDAGAKLAAAKIRAKLSDIRSFIRDVARVVTQGDTEVVFESSTDGLDCPGTVSSILLFLELVECLILKSLRLYYTWVKVEAEAIRAFPTILEE